MTIREARENANLTQAEVAKIFHVSKRAVEEWESGRRNPKDRQIAEKISAWGTMTADGRESILADETTWDEALALHKVTTAKRISKWGKYGDTFHAILGRVPGSVFDTLTGEQLAELIDSLQDAYNDGVYYGRHHVEE